MDGSMTALVISLPTMMFSYNLGVTHIKKPKTFVGRWHELLITNVFVNRIAKPLGGGGGHGGKKIGTPRGGKGD